MHYKYDYAPSIHGWTIFSLLEQHVEHLGHFMLPLDRHHQRADLGADLAGLELMHS
jgi:hypothetical protein